MLVCRHPNHWRPKPGQAWVRARRIVHSSSSSLEDLSTNARTRSNNADTSVIEITDSSDDDDDTRKPPVRLPCQNQTNTRAGPLPASEHGLLVLYAKPVFDTYMLCHEPSDALGTATATNLAAHESRCVVRSHQKQSLDGVLRMQETRARPASCERFRRCRHSPSRTRRTRAPFLTILLLPPPPLPPKRPRGRSSPPRLLL